MKNLLTMAAVFMLATACTRQTDSEIEGDKWNGYSRFLKMGEQVHTLWAGKHHNIGTVTYGIDEDANFYVKYNCSDSGWNLTETHVYAGNKSNMPLNRPGAPKIGLFPYTSEHITPVRSYTHRIPLEDLPPCSAPGFVVAAHAVVQNLAGNSETAWAEGDYTFSDKGWGWYDDYYYNSSNESLTIIYGITSHDDTLQLYHIDVTHAVSELIFSEYVEASSGNFNATAYDPDSSLIFFADANTGALYINRLNTESPSFCAGYLTGTASGASFSGQSYYYVDAATNTINQVNFTSAWNIESEIALDTIPVDVTVNDIAMEPAGERLFISAEIAGHSLLITWNRIDHTFISYSVSLNDGAQIAFGNDGRLYAVASLFDDDPGSWIYVIEVEAGTLIVVDDEIIITEEPFLDLAGG